MTGVQTLTVAEDEGEQRLDRWFKRRFPNVTQGAVEKLCRTGQVRVDGGRVKASDHVAPGQAIRVPPLPDGPAPDRPAGISATDERMIQDAVIFRDQHLIVLNKPPGLASQGGSGQGERHVDGLTGALNFGYKERPKLVHRLDKDTSGLLMLARTDRVARALSEALRHRAARKIYWAVVAGVPNPKQGSVKFALMKAPGHGRGGEGEKMVCIHPAKAKDYPDAKRAQTDFFTLWFLGSRLSWMALEPVTGRTHQLRAHMAEIGHPILGDGKYGGSASENAGDGWGAGIGGEFSRKLHLHARSLTIEHPVTKEPMTFTAALPDHMARTWKALDWREGDVPADPFGGDPVSVWAAKRFWTLAVAVPCDGGFTVQLDARPVRTPAKAPLILPTLALAQAVADEWQAQEGPVRPATMPFTRMANSALDKVAPQRAAVVAEVARFGATDLLCYRAGGPVELVARQAADWDPMLDWAADVLQAPLVVTTGVVPVAQPEESLARLTARVAAMDPFALVALHDLTSISGSLVLALAVAAGRLTPEQAFALSRIDEVWQAEQWGEDAEAAQSEALKAQGMDEAGRFLALCRQADV